MSEAKGEEAKEASESESKEAGDLSDMMANLPADLNLCSGCMDDYEVIKP